MVQGQDDATKYLGDYLQERIGERFNVKGPSTFCGPLVDAYFVLSLEVSRKKTTAGAAATFAVVKDVVATRNPEAVADRITVVV